MNFKKSKMTHLYNERGDFIFVGPSSQAWHTTLQMWVDVPFIRAKCSWKGPVNLNVPKFILPLTSTSLLPLQGSWIMHGSHAIWCDVAIAPYMALPFLFGLRVASTCRENCIFFVIFIHEMLIDLRVFNEMKCEILSNFSKFYT